MYEEPCYYFENDMEERLLSTMSDEELNSYMEGLSLGAYEGKDYVDYE